jgi:predicted PurR-regulated permease PerM
MARPRSAPVAEERWIRVRARTVAMAAVVFFSVALAFVVGIQVLMLARTVLTWILISIFLALAINPLVEWIRRRGVPHRLVAVLIAFTIVLGSLAAVLAVFVPPLVTEVNEFADSVPGYVEDLTAGRGPLGFLESDYQVVERVTEALEGGAVERAFDASGFAVSLTKSILSLIAAIVAILFMTLFMLLEGPTWLERFYALFPAEKEPRWRRVGRQVYRTVGGYVAGNLIISVIAGVTSGTLLALLGVPYAAALGLLVALLDLVPLAGATVAAVIVTTVAFLTGTAEGLVVLVFFIVYQQIENHILQPLVYGRTVKLSPLAVLIAVLIGAQLAGILGALAAIPVAGTIQVVLADVLRERKQRQQLAPAPAKG